MQASFQLAKAFGWTPAQIQDMTMAQINLYLQMLQNDSEGNG